MIVLAARRGTIRKLDAEGLPVRSSAPRVVEPKPAPVIPVAAPVQFVPQFEVSVPRPVQVRRPLPPSMFETPQVPPQEQVQAFQPMPVNYNVEQVSAPRASAVFSNEESVSAEKQPGTNSLSKFLVF